MKSFVKEWVIPLIAGCILAFIIKQLLFFVAFVPTGSMEPTIQPGERLLVTRVHKPEKLKRNDIVVFNFEEAGQVLVKRLIGLPGDKIKIIEGVLFINGEEIDEPYIVYADKETSFGGEEITIPEDSYLFLGDNRPGSLDGRFWSSPFIKESDIIGKARFVIFPLNKIRTVK